MPGFRDTKQRAETCRALCALAGRYDLWSSTGPTEKAAGELVASPLLEEDLALVRAAWSVWNGLGDLHLAELLRVLRPSDLRALAELLTALAVSPLQVDAWLASYAPPQIPRLRPVR